MYRKGVVGIVINSRREFLLLHRKLTWKGWEFPKGNLEKETEEEAILREVKEETGLYVKILKRLPSAVRYTYPVKNAGYEGAKQSVFLLLSPTSPKERVKLSVEHDDYRWANSEAAKKLLSWKDQKEALRKALECLSR